VNSEAGSQSQGGSLGNPDISPVAVNLRKLTMPDGDLCGDMRTKGTRIYVLATRGYLSAAHQIQSLVPSLAGRVIPTPYDTLLRRMTRAYWKRQARESYWGVRTNRWSSTWEGLHAAVTLGVQLVRFLCCPGRPKSGTYVFTDLERLSPAELQKAAIVWQALAGTEIGIRLLNHPTRSMRRYELLRTLYERGINSFDVYRLTEARWPTRYPVFLRREHDHDGPISPLLRTRSELKMALDALYHQGEVRDRLMIVEFCDTADTNGIYRRYGAFVIGGHVFVNGVVFSRHWVQKKGDLDEPDMLREERQYVEENPHQDALREIFGLAGIDYGRMDYGLLDGKVQVWEINTNPTIIGSRLRRSVERQPIRERFDREMASALEQLASG
jgi:hypothetical protein